MAELVATERANIVAIADEIRTLQGTSSDMNLGTMINSISGINNDIQQQESLIIQIAAVLEGKAAGSPSEDITAEVNEYTEKIASLESAVSALEIELAGKASGGSGGVETYTGTVYGPTGLGDNPDVIYVYTDKNMTARAVALTKGDSATVTIASGSFIAGGYWYGAVNHSEEELINYILSHFTGGSAIYLPTSDGFEI